MRDFELADYTRSMTINKKRRAQGSRTPFFTNSQASADYYELRVTVQFPHLKGVRTQKNGVRRGCTPPADTIFLDNPLTNGRAGLFSSIAEQGKGEQGFNGFGHQSRGRCERHGAIYHKIQDKSEHRISNKHPTHQRPLSRQE